MAIYLRVHLHNIAFVLTLAFFVSMTSCANPYQYLMFVQQWPMSVSARSSLLEFKIHGLWPSNFSVHELNCTGADLDLSEMKKNKTLQSQLVKSWPNVKDKNQHMKFWASEYDKHGKCSDNEFPQLEYFRVSNKMWKNYNISKMFKSYPKFPIVPGSTYNKSDLLAAIKFVTTFDSNVRCKNSILSDVVICFDSRGKDVINCDPGKTCNATQIEFRG